MYLQVQMCGESAKEITVSVLIPSIFDISENKWIHGTINHCPWWQQHTIL